MSQEILQEIETMMYTPSEALIEDVKKIDGDIMILGVSGKMGYNLAALLVNALREAGIKKKVYGVARFSGGKKDRQRFDDLGVETIVADFLEPQALDKLPQVENIIYMVGYKFGASGNEAYTWALNSYLPGKVAESFPNSKIVAFSTGTVYQLVDVRSTAPSEEVKPEPYGEYAQSCLGRERIFEYFSELNKTPTFIYRLNYAIDVRYGVLVELALAIKNREAIDLSMGHVNVIWQPDACEVAIRALNHTTVPANVVNVTGPETLSVRWLAETIGQEMGIKPIFTGQEEDTALLSNASKAHELFGYPQTSIREMIRYIVTWIENGGELDDKPTHFQEREGEF